MKKLLKENEIIAFKLNQEDMKEILCEHMFGNICEYANIKNDITDVITSVDFIKEEDSYSMVVTARTDNNVDFEIDELGIDKLKKTPTTIKAK